MNNKIDSAGGAKPIPEELANRIRNLRDKAEANTPQPAEGYGAVLTTVRFMDGGIVQMDRADYDKLTHPAATAVVLTDAERSTIETLLHLAYAAWGLADNAEDAGAEGLAIERSDFAGLEKHLDMLDELPDDQPGYVMEAAAKARWSLRGLLAAAPAAPKGGAVNEAMVVRHADAALAHLSNALDDLESSPDERPMPLIREAMGHLRELTAALNPEQQP